MINKIRLPAIVFILAAVFSSNAFCDNHKMKRKGPTKQETSDFIVEKIYGCPNFDNEFPKSVTLNGTTLFIEYSRGFTISVPLATEKEYTFQVGVNG